jgi:hypothetical protein
LKFSQFKAKTGIFGRPENRYTWELLAKKEVDSVTWWKGFYSETKLSKIISALSVVPFTSSANERDFSLRGFIHTKNRNRYFLNSVFCFNNNF